MSMPDKKLLNKDNCTAGAYFDDPDFIDEVAEAGYKLFWHNLHGSSEAKIESLREDLISLLFKIVLMSE